MEIKFEDFRIDQDILKAIEALGYKKPSNVQENVIPKILEDTDVIVKSQTGSGKTAAFAIPLCQKIDWNENNAQALILTPTRELAVQIKEDVINIGRFKRIRSVAVFGKQPFSEQVRELKQKTHIVVGTPGRVLDHIERGTLVLSNIKYLVIDEADEMLNMGFIEQVESIIKKISLDRVTMLFSATMPEAIEKLCQKYMKDAMSIEIQAQKLITDKIEHKLYKVNNENRLKTLNEILIEECPDTAIVFCKTKENVELVLNYLSKKNYSVNKIHGGMLQKERLDTMNNFRKGDFRILIATDVAARGIDIEGITHVINYDVPMEKEAYVHRIGRTGRAGAKGKAITFFSDFEKRFLDDIEEYIGFNIDIFQLSNDKNTEAINILKTRPKTKKQKSGNLNKGITKIYINGGKKKKIRPGDIVGAITKIESIVVEDIGIIDVQDNVSYVDILNGKGNEVLKELKNMTIKGKKLKVEKAKK